MQHDDWSANPMKPPRRCTAPFVVAGVLALCSWTSEAAIEPGKPAAVASQVAELELAWRPGDGVGQYRYFSRAAQLGRSLYQYEQGAANAAALDLLKNLLTKRGTVSEPREVDFEVGAADLIALRDVAAYLLAEANIELGPQMQKIDPFSRLLGRIRAEVVVDYVRKPVARSVPLPEGASTGGTVPVYTGMDPKDIANPVARKEYEAAIRQHRLTNLSNKRQEQLQKMESQFAEPIVHFLARVAASDPGARPLVRQAIDNARLTEWEREQVLKALAP